MNKFVDKARIKYLDFLKCLCYLKIFTRGMYMVNTFYSKINCFFYRFNNTKSFLYDFILIPVTVAIITIICAIISKADSKSILLAILF